MQGSRDQVAAPVLQGPAYSLEIVVPVDESTGDRWQAGVEFDPAACAGGGRTALQGCNLAFPDGEGWDDGAATNPELAVADPFVVWHVEECSTFPARRDFAARARQALTTTRSFWIAQALWEGYDLDGDQEQRPLADMAADTLTDGATAEVPALACLDAGLARCGRGRRGLIHVTIEVLQHLVAASALVRNGNRWETPIGNVVVADAGYTGTGPNGEPAGDTQWGYATSPISLRLSAMTITPPGLDNDADRALALVDIGSANANTIRVVAAQLALYQWDECCHLAAEFDVPICLTGGTS